MKRICKTLHIALWLSGFLISFSQTAFAQVPVLNSYPAAAAVIFLDFDGHTVEGSSWNSDGPIICGPSNMNAAQVTEVFNRVSEDYRPFNINVTTDSTKYWAASATQRMRIILTTTSDWYGRVGGVSFTNSFTWGDNTPAFVFTELLNYNTKNIAEAASHETGHTLGLRHQAAYDANCAKTSDYNYGKGDGEIGWAPIMGVGYYRNYTIWHNGSNPYGCTSYQDDLSIITSGDNGFGYRPNDYDSSFEKAYMVTLDNNKFSNSGIISTDKDKDMFQLNLDVTGHVQVSATPYNVGTGDAGSNLDVQIKLFNADQQLIGMYNPADRLDATIDTLLEPGTYYYCISGAKNQYATEYASLGSYAINGMVTDIPTTLNIKKLNLQGELQNDMHKLSWVVDASEKVLSQAVEVSNNGIDFEKIAQVSKSERTYAYVPTIKGRLQYRINIGFTNKHQTYTNAVALINTAFVAKPYLASNLLYSSNATIISPASYNYIISDYAGRVVAQGKLVQGENNILTGNIVKGMYIIQYSNNTKQYAEKFIKQ